MHKVVNREHNTKEITIHSLIRCLICFPENAVRLRFMVHIPLRFMQKTNVP